MSDKEKIDDLEHELLEEKIETMNSKMHSGFELLGNIINDGFEKIRIENKAQNDASNVQRKEILKKQDITNGRVKALEKVTSKLKFLQENKKIAILVFYAIYNILEITNIENALKIIQWIRLVI